MNIKVSIVIPTFNSSAPISNTIRACMEQDFLKEKIEIICVDDGSTDNTEQIINKYPVSYIYQKRGGPAIARNAGWKKAKGEIICFTDADCVPEKRWVSKLLKNYTSEKIGAVGGSYGIMNPNSLLANCIHQEIIFRHSKMPKYVRALGSYNFSVRKEVLKEVDGFNEEYKMASAEDNDLSYKILKKGYYLIFDKDIKVSHFYLSNLKKYLKSQFWHGFWRVKLYKDHINMAKGDDYSNILDYIQPILCFIIIGLIPFSFIYPINFLLLLLLFSEIIMQLPVPFLIVKRRKNLKYLMLIPITFIRGFFRGFGMFFGIWEFFLRSFLWKKTKS